MPYQYPVTKAYEMISCFEGLLELYRVTGDEKCKKAALNFTDRILETDFTVIGSCGCTHEFLDHSTVRQAKEETGPLMEERYLFPRHTPQMARCESPLTLQNLHSFP